jgi:gluconokinase
MQRAAPPTVVVMGVAGSGKSTVGRLVADRLHVAFLDADDFHDRISVEMMRAGTPLTDEQRAPWLRRLHELLAAHDGAGVVLACSALTPAYREVLRGDLGDVRFVALVVSEPELVRRLTERRGHYAGRALLDSQLDTLELGDDVVEIDGEHEPSRVADEIVEIVRRD